jgi:hypothetical protein
MSAHDDLLARNRVILAHFDSYSTALVFARWGKTMFWPEALPEGAQPMAPPEVVDAVHAPGPVHEAVVSACGLIGDELAPAADFNHWAQTETGPVRIHLMRFTTFDAPKALIDTAGGVFKPISELRGTAMSELVLLRAVFDLIIGAGGGRA